LYFLQKLDKIESDVGSLKVKRQGLTPGGLAKETDTDKEEYKL